MGSSLLRGRLRPDQYLRPPVFDAAHALPREAVVEHVPAVRGAVKPGFEGRSRGLRVTDEVFRRQGIPQVRFFQPVGKTFLIGAGVAEEPAGDHVGAVIEGDGRGPGVPDKLGATDAVALRVDQPHEFLNRRVPGIEGNLVFGTVCRGWQCAEEEHNDEEPFHVQPALIRIRLFLAFK